jgi:hypothetical protein
MLNPNAEGPLLVCGCLFAVSAAVLYSWRLYPPFTMVIMLMVGLQLNCIRNETFQNLHPRKLGMKLNMIPYFNQVRNIHLT